MTRCHDSFVQRALIDYDFAAHGIWLITSSSFRSDSVGRSDSHTQRAVSREGGKTAQSWSQLLSGELLSDLQSWNDWGCQLNRSSSIDGATEPIWSTFYRNARDLAARTQMELGASWQVLWMEGGAWHFVRPPWLFS
jgi:hypothetical protein